MISKLERQIMVAFVAWRGSQKQYAPSKIDSGFEAGYRAAIKAHEEYSRDLLHQQEWMIKRLAVLTESIQQMGLIHGMTARRLSDLENEKHLSVVPEPS